MFEELEKGISKGENDCLKGIYKNRRNIFLYFQTNYTKRKCYYEQTMSTQMYHCNTGLGNTCSQS